ncbi:MAG: hypothetical protein B6I26_02280 [Desulfobacteraceae bacterium 4572_130]|nr:MAG: hypothetical protein B6I26_02280 [Desulfobacteraceae bacterium 4572_130]
METFLKLKKLIKNPLYQAQKQKSMINLNLNIIDAPIIKLIKNFNNLPYCFTLQSCYGHFLYKGQKDSHNLAPLPITNTINKTVYKIAYIVFCIEKSVLGTWLFKALKKITAIDHKNIQFCCAQWFWEKQINSYVLQVEPDRFKHKDKVILDYKEALYIEKIRNKFFIQLNNLLENI